MLRLLSTNVTRSASIRFRLILDAAKHVIYAVDGLLSLGRPRFHPLPVGRPLPIPRPRPADPTSTLSAWLVETQIPSHGAVLLLHGIGDRIEYWRDAQALLAAHGITSLIFHYSGYRGSGGSTTPEQLEADVLAAYNYFRTLLPPALPIHILAFSLGTGLAVSVCNSLDPQPAGLILAEAYTTLREAASRMGRQAGFLSILLPDLWRTIETIGSLRLPILLVHSYGDTLFPVSMAQQLYRAAEGRGAGTKLALLNDFSHNAIYLHVPENYWQPILEFLSNPHVKR